ncbi:40S ribosomal protein S27-like [Perognathus longimembris pacificus]|uniref:40S ribosomal protein S27-like n=1 Tax=Perognathus longimembris pacificus TaxID=214514 RepID=UPI002019B552|nr:40S ribosomal protein S27-like [Perognathus longimembris pacificus]
MIDWCSYESRQPERRTIVLLENQEMHTEWEGQLSDGDDLLPRTASRKGLLHPSPEEKRNHKKKHLVQSPNSYFMDVKCPGCYKITTVFSHAQTVVLCVGCSTVLCQPTGGKARLTEGCSFRRKQH